MKIGDKRKKLEEEKGIIIRFVIGHRWASYLSPNLIFGGNTAHVLAFVEMYHGRTPGNLMGFLNMFLASHLFRFRC